MRRSVNEGVRRLIYFAGVNPSLNSKRKVSSRETSFPRVSREFPEVSREFPGTSACGGAAGSRWCKKDRGYAAEESADLKRWRQETAAGRVANRPQLSATRHASLPTGSAAVNRRTRQWIWCVPWF
jgi:hypothetical protein